MVDLGSVIRPGDGILWGQACAEPQTLVEALVSQRSRLGGVGCFLGSSYSGLVKPESAFVDPGYCIEYGKRVNNYDTTRPFGRVNFTQALQYSINSVFCEVGKRLGGRRILEYGRRFGFYELPQLELPDQELRESGLYQKGKPFFPKQDFQVDPGRLAFGQERLQVTPLQLAMVAAGIANGGTVMRPYLVDRIEAPAGILNVPGGDFGGAFDRLVGP